MNDLSESFPLWNGTATVRVTEPGQLEAARRAVEEVIADSDMACGPGRNDSELARVMAAEGRPVQVGATFHAILWTALHAADVVQGPVETESWRSIRIDDPPGTVALPTGASLDFSGAMRAFTADRAVERASAETGCGVLVSIGGDIAVAGPVPIGGWQVRLDHDHDITLYGPCGVAGTRLSARPRPWRTISVLAQSCVEAMIAGRAALARRHGAGNWLVSHGLAARLGHVEGWTTGVGGWPATFDDQFADDPMAYAVA
jgi:thiamine biosynthesis lipoprotein